MSARSGIVVSEQLNRAFAAALDNHQVRFIKASISNEEIVLDSQTNVRSDFTGDLEQLQDILSDSSPAYVLARFDEPRAQEWLAISYVPDTAKVRDKMLYASSRSAITQSLGSGYFTESIFASTKAELTPEGYKAHQAHMAAPQPLSTREKELADLKHAERGAEGSVSGGTQSRKNHIGHTVGLVWDESLSDAVLALGEATTNQLVLGAIDIQNETLVLTGTAEVGLSELPTALPVSDPAYAFFAWCRDDGSKALIFIYSCPPGAPVKSRMLYAASAGTTMHAVKQHLGNQFQHIKRMETSEQIDLNAITNLLGEDATDQPVKADVPKSFSRPRGPAKKR